MKQYKKYWIIGVGLLVTVLLAIALIYLNKSVFTKAFLAVDGNSNKKLIINNLIGSSALLVSIASFILFLNEDTKKDE